MGSNVGTESRRIRILVVSNFQGHTILVFRKIGKKNFPEKETGVPCIDFATPWAFRLQCLK